MLTVDFKFDLWDKVVTPLCNGIVTMIGYDEQGPTYFISNNIQGCADKWWPESTLTAE